MPGKRIIKCNYVGYVVYYRLLRVIHAYFSIVLLHASMFN